MRCCLPALLLLIVFSSSSHAQSETERRNWFNDPFFQISDHIADCPMPAGPYVTAVARTAEAHHRAERGTTCWLVGKCDRPTSYAYDQDIADAFKSALTTDNRFEHSTLWVTVQGRVVYIEGCAKNQGLAREIEAFAMKLPYVELAVAKVRSDQTAPPPYTLFNNP